MPDKTFDQVVPFHQLATHTGPIFLPLLTVTIVQSTGARIALPLMFDTGASRTTLRADLYPVLEATAWNAGHAELVGTAGDDHPATCYRYDNVTMEVLGKTIICAVNLMEMPANPLYHGLLGRETIYEQFGFGFWESDHELLVSSAP